MLELSLRILEEGDSKNGSAALKSLEVCLESLEEDTAGQSREQAHTLSMMPCQKDVFMFHPDPLTLPQALVALQRVERLLLTVKDGLMVSSSTSGEVSDIHVRMWGEYISNLVHSLGVLLKHVTRSLSPTCLTFHALMAISCAILMMHPFPTLQLILVPVSSLCFR